MKNWWVKLFLEERPSISLSFFRIAVALTTGLHVLPTFCHLGDNYLSTAYKTYNTSFFPIWFLELIQKSPDFLVIGLVWVYCIFWFFFLIGFKGRFSCIVLTLSGYYFYALNSLHVGTLSWDILQVTLFLMCLTPYHSDYFSVDAWLKSDPEAYRVRRPFFIQRLLQMQIACTYFYTALYKISAQGNWLQGNPIYYLMNYPPEGVMKYSMLKDFLANKPELCQWLGWGILVWEFSMPLLLFWRKTRISAIYLGVVFHIFLILMMDVPAIFFFLFPAQLVLFINPQHILEWVEQKRLVNRSSLRSKLIYDGRCRFCQESVRKLKVMDLFEVLEFVDLHQVDLVKCHPDLTPQKAAAQLHLIEPNGRMFGGFQVFTRLCFMMPMLYPFVFVFYFPGMSVVGPYFYRFIAKNRHFLLVKKMS